MDHYTTQAPQARHEAVQWWREPFTVLGQRNPNYTPGATPDALASAASEMVAWLDTLVADPLAFVRHARRQNAYILTRGAIHDVLATYDPGTMLPPTPNDKPASS